VSDFYQDSARRRLEQIDAERAAALADLGAHKMNADHDSAALTIQTIANLDSERRNIVDLHERYVQSQQPPAAEQLTDEERNARPWNKMTPDDALALARTSKYGRDLDWNNRDVIAGWHEAQRRRREPGGR
jgi:hypothetical protein